MKEFFAVQYDADAHPDRWHLDDPIDASGNILDANLLPKMGPYIGPSIAAVQIDTRYPGRALDFSFGYFNFLVVRTFVADLIEQHGGHIQRFPVVLKPGDQSGYELIFTLDAPKGLIDLDRADEYQFHETTDPVCDMRYMNIAPRQKGMLYKVYDLYIDAERAKGLTIFRPWEYASLIISGDLKRAFEAAEVTGISYRLVS
jgi:hypothetical protein